MKIWQITLALCIAAASVMAQLPAIEDVSGDIVANRFMEYEEISISWTMEGMLQAALNEGLNAMLEGNPGVAEQSFSRVLKQYTRSY
jgi:hypothetical protein